MTVYDDLKQKKVIVTGGGSGIGHAVARAFASQCADVLIIGRNADKLKRAARDMGTQAQWKTFDLGSVEAIPELVADIHSSFGTPDILVNNAGVNLKKPAENVSTEEFRRIATVNGTAVFALTREVGKGMVSRGAGNIIMISSMASRYGLPGVIAYTAAKSAVEGMTRALAVEWSPRGVRVNCIAPGFITTEMSAAALDNDPERKRKVLSRTPMGSLGEPEDIANAVLFLASSQSRYITGVVLPVDGGNSIGF